MTAANSTNKAPILRTMFGNELADHIWGEDSFVDGMAKDTGGFGDVATTYGTGTTGRVVVIRVAQVNGTSPSFARALANVNPAAEKRFSVQPKKIYTIIRLDGLFMRQARGKPNALIKGYESEARSAMIVIKRRLAKAMWGNAGGSIGQIDATTVLTTTTLKFRNTRALFGEYPIGMRIAFSSDNGTPTSPAGLRGPSPDNPTLLTITGVDHNANTVTTDATLDTVPGITVNDFVFFDGFYAASMSGKQAWNPVTAPTAGDNFFGVDRSTHVDLLSGWRVSAGASMESTAIDALIMSAQAEVGKNNKIYANMFDWGRFAKEVGVKYIREAGDAKQGAGAKGIEVYGPAGSATLVGGNLTPAGNAWLGDPSTDLLLSEGDCPDVLDEDDVGALLRAATDDAYESRLGAYANQLPNDKRSFLGPGGWVIITWPTA